MQLPFSSSALAAAFSLALVAAGYAPALSQDFSITNPEEAANAGRRDVMRQLQAWWDVHGYYPRHASQNDEGGTVKLHLEILSDGRIWSAKVALSSGSNSLDAAASAAFRGGFVRPFPEGVPEADLDISLHYVLAHRHDQPVVAGYTPAASRGPFTIANDPVESPILATMMQRTCTGTVVKEGIRNHPWYGGHHWVQAVFFRKPDDGTPWVKFYDGGEPLLAPVNEVGKMVQWTGKGESPRRGVSLQYQYTVWPNGDNKLSGNIEAYFYASASQGINTGGTVDLTCATEIVPPITWSALMVRTIQAPPGDPP
jgi:TonB family protein